MAESSIIIKKNAQGVATITLNRPEIHNAFDDHMIGELTHALVTLDKDPQIRIIVFAANGKSFSAGADLNWMKKMASYDWEQNYQDSLQLAGLMQSLHNCQKITIALVQGAAFGGGVGLVACCDIVLASESAFFCLSEVKLGLIPAVISPYVINAIGDRQAKRYFITAEKFNAQQAKDIQLVHQVFKDESLMSDAEVFINNILLNAPQAVLNAKRLINHVNYKPINEELIRETALRIADTRSSVEGKEGIAAFLEKRKANWFKLKNEIE